MNLKIGKVWRKRNDQVNYKESCVRDAQIALTFRLKFIDLR